MDLTNVPTATLSELADGSSAINQIGPVRSKALQIALANVSGVLYVSRALGKTWEPNGIIAGGAKLPAIPVNNLVTMQYGGVIAASVTNGGQVDSEGGNFFATTYASVAGSGSGATFTVTVIEGEVTGVVSIEDPGYGFIQGEVIKLDIPSIGVTNRPKLTCLVVGSY